MKNLMKQGVMSLVLSCVFAFSHLAQADVRSMVFNDGLTEITYDWNALNDEITNFDYSILSPAITSFVPVDTPLFLGDAISFDANGSDGFAEIDFNFSGIQQDFTTDLYTHLYDLSIYYVDIQQIVFFDAPVAFTEISGVSAVPVPAALPLMASALGLFGLAKRRQS